MLTDASGPVQIDVPRDRADTFEPQIVKKRQRRLSGVDEVVLSLYAKGLTTGETSADFAEIYGTSVSKETISRITDKVIEEMTDWSHRPLDETYAAVFIDAIVVKVFRNVARRGGRAQYRAVAADEVAAAGRQRPKAYGVNRSPRLQAVVTELLKGGWSPASIDLSASRRLTAVFGLDCAESVPDDHAKPLAFIILIKLAQDR